MPKEPEEKGILSRGYGVLREISQFGMEIGMLFGSFDTIEKWINDAKADAAAKNNLAIQSVLNQQNSSFAEYLGSLPRDTIF